MKNLISLMVLLSSLTTFAGHRGGNGGDAVVCEDKVYMLDYVEAYNDDPSFEKNGNVRNLVSELLLNAKKKDQYLYEHIAQTSEDFLKGIEEYEESGELLTSTTEFTDKILSDVTDEGSYEIPKGCNVHQLIIRREVSTFVPTTFLVQRELWDKMSNYQKAIAVTHEAMYKYMLDVEQTNSFVARNYNQLLMKDEFSVLTDYDYFKLVVEYELFSTFIVKGVVFNRNKDDYNLTRELPSNPKTEDFYYFGSKISFHDNGTIHKVFNGRNHSINYGEFEDQLKDFSHEFEVVTFNLDGLIESYKATVNNKKLNFQGYSVAKVDGNWLYFDSKVIHRPLLPAFSAGSMILGFLTFGGVWIFDEARDSGPNVRVLLTKSDDNSEAKNLKEAFRIGFGYKPLLKWSRNENHYETFSSTCKYSERNFLARKNSYKYNQYSDCDDYDALLSHDFEFIGIKKRKTP